MSVSNFKKMQARIHVYGFLKHVVPPRFRNRPAVLEFESPMTVFKILTVNLGRKKLDDTVLVNGKIANTEFVVQDGDEVHIFPPIAGG